MIGSLGRRIYFDPAHVRRQVLRYKHEVKAARRQRFIMDAGGCRVSHPRMREFPRVTERWLTICEWCRDPRVFGAARFEVEVTAKHR